MRRSPILLVMGAIALATSCRGDGGDAAAGAPPDSESAAAVADSDQAAALAASAAPQAGPEQAPEEVYFDLTRFDWYRRAQPLVHDSRGYLPEGDPVAAPADSMQKIGRYQGVDYYARRGEPRPFYALYVPVYYHYWQRFVATPSNDRVAS